MAASRCKIWPKSCPDVIVLDLVMTEWRVRFWSRAAAPGIGRDIQVDGYGRPRT